VALPVLHGAACWVSRAAPVHTHGACSGPSVRPFEDTLCLCSIPLSLRRMFSGARCKVTYICIPEA
jgi:hypothetical protein